MGLVEILVIILFLMAIGMVWVYCVKKKKQQRQRELNDAMRDAYRPAANSEIYPHRASFPMVQFQTPGNRTVTMQQEPTAPAQTPATLGLWDQCR